MPNQRKKILVVEDEAPIRHVLTLKAGNMGYEVVTAVDAADGLAKALEHRPDLILTDHKMPGKMQGMDLIKAIKTSPALSSVPVILLTGSVVVEYTFAADLQDFEGVAIMPKPFKMSNLFDMVAKLLADSTGDATEA